MWVVDLYVNAFEVVTTLLDLVSYQICGGRPSNDKSEGKIYLTKKFYPVISF